MGTVTETVSLEIRGRSPLGVESERRSMDQSGGSSPCSDWHAALSLRRSHRVECTKKVRFNKKIDAWYKNKQGRQGGLKLACEAEVRVCNAQRDVDDGGRK